MSRVRFEIMVLEDEIERETLRASIANRAGQADKKGWTAWTATFTTTQEETTGEAPHDGHLDEF